MLEGRCMSIYAVGIESLETGISLYGGGGERDRGNSIEPAGRFGGPFGGATWLNAIPLDLFLCPRLAVVPMVSEPARDTGREIPFILRST